MLKFVNKEGKNVMELNDNGEVEILSEKLKKSFSKVVEAAKEQEDKKWTKH